jgi:hypothetical protein
VTAAHVRHARLRDAAAKRGVPLATILVTVVVVALVYLAGKLAYRIRDVLLMIAVAGRAQITISPPRISQLALFMFAISGLILRLAGRLLFGILPERAVMPAHRPDIAPARAGGLWY